MSGFDHSPLADINLIRQNLEDRYRDGASVVKELVQNADDAGATTLDLGWTQSLPSARHPLLSSCPAFFARNNGRFEQRHAQGLHQLGLSEKGSETPSIGKFGLGLKSVFHLCEAFFYLSSGHSSFASSAADGRYPANGFFNPWSSPQGDRHHEGWGDLFTDQDQALVKARLVGLPQEACWFCLWVPLRRRGTYEPCDPIGPDHPGDGDALPRSIFKDDVESELANLLPMLRSLRIVRGWQADGVGTLRQTFLVRFGDSSTRSALVDRNTPGEASFDGHVVVESTRGSWRVPFAGEEQILRGDFDGLRAQPDWPKHFVISDPTRGRSESQPDKATAHSAVYLSRGPRASAGGRLDVRWTVFLPLDDEIQRLTCDVDTDFALTLHGYFFLDAGRRRIDFGAARSRGRSTERLTVQQVWNSRLRDEGLLPLILPALGRFVRVVDLSSPDAAAVTAAVEKSDLFREHRDQICQKHEWTCRAGAAADLWQTTAAGDPYYEIPSPPEDQPTLHWEVFPELRAMTARHHVTYAGIPRLTSRPPSGWSEEMVEAVLSGPDRGVFSDAAKLGYLVEFLEASRDTISASPRLGARVVEVVRGACRSMGGRQIRQRAQDVARVLDLLPREKLVVVDLPAGTSGGVYERILSALWSADTDALLVPSDVLRREPDTQVAIQTSDAIALLVALDRIATEGGEAPLNAVRSAVALQVVAGVAVVEREVLWASGGDLDLFIGYDCRAGGNRTVSYRTLRSVLRQRMLFSGQVAQAQVLQRALRGGPVMVIPLGVAGGLFPGGEVRGCSWEACLETLATRPALTGSSERLELLKRLGAEIGDQITAAFRRGIRYLLHAESTQFEDDEPLYVGRERSGRHRVWGRMAQISLRGALEGWRAVGRELAQVLALATWPALGLEEIEPDGVMRLLRRLGPEQVAGSELSAEERDALVQECPERHLDILKRIAIHETSSGSFVSIDERSYWEGEIALPKDILGTIELLRLSRNPMVRARQLQMASVLGVDAALRLLLDRGRPDQHARAILDVLVISGEVPEQVRDLVAGTAWLPTASGVPCAPSVVIRLVGADDVIARVLAGADRGARGGGPVPFLEIVEDVRRHRGFRAISVLFPDRPRGLEMLGESLGDRGEMRIGSVDIDALGLDGFLVGFRRAENVMPVVPIVEQLADRDMANEIIGRMLRALALPITEERVVAILNHLAQRHEEAIEGDRVPLKRLFNGYLGAATRMDEFATVLTQIRLLSEHGSWKHTRTLVSEAEGVAGDWLLDAEQGRILGPNVRFAEGSSVGSSDADTDRPWTVPDKERTRQFQRTVQALQQFRGDWLSAGIDDPVIGGVLALLGDDPGVRSLAEDTLDPRSVSALRDSLHWTPLRGQIGGADEDIHSAMRLQRCIVELTDRREVRLQNLLGERVDVPVSGAFDNLVLGRMPALSGPGYRLARVRLRRVRHPRELPPGVNPNDLMRETARAILAGVYWQQVPNLDQVWDELAHSEQLDVELAQRLMLEGLFFYVRQLGGFVGDEVRDVLRQWDRARGNLAQADRARSDGRDWSTTRERAAAAVETLRDKLRSLLESDPATQADLLKAVQEKVRQYQYALQSIPFELFQNADDAVVELRQLEGARSPDEAARERFVVTGQGPTLRFAHWGRPINQFRRGVVDGRDQGFDRDLEKMLALSMSDKVQDEGAQSTTGKFGLGFKSVFLISDTPRVLSGRLGFEVVGGMWPRRLTEVSEESLRDFRMGLDAQRSDGTVIELPWREDETTGPAAWEAVMDRFIELGHVLVVFARRIKRCDVTGPDGMTETVEWREQGVPGAAGVCAGYLSPVGGGSRPAIVLRLGRGAVLFGLGARGVEPLPDSVPTMWVTAPTEDHANIGFAVNGDFEVDAGRARIAVGALGNQLLADELGIELGCALCGLYDAMAEQPTATVQAMGLDQGATALSVWSSFWALFAKPVITAGGGVGQLVMRMLWGGSSSGMLRLVSERDALPNGLPGDACRLTRISRVRSVTRGVLDDAETYAAVMRWPRTRERWRPEEILAGAVFDVFRKVWSECPPRRALDLVNALELEIGPSLQVDTERAVLIGELVTPKYLADLEAKGGIPGAEVAGIRRFLREVRFRAHDGEWQPAERLLLSSVDEADQPDEARRARFAPSRRILANDYMGPARSFVRACRGAMRAPAEELAAWAVDAGSEEQRRAVVAYLVEGELGRELAHELRHQLDGSWLAELELTSGILGELDRSDRVVILAQLGLLGSWPGSVSPPPGPAASAARVLEGLYEWWMSRGDALVEEYETLLYPGEEFPQRISNVWDSSLETRKSWLTLFMLGAMHTLGRTTTSQDQGFVSFCQSRGWLNVFAGSDDQFDRWMDVLRQYAEGQVEDGVYTRWMAQFPSIFQLAYWLPQYVEAFLAIDRIPGRFGLHEVTRPRASSIFQGGGPDAPPVSRTLGIGACFVVRELVRARVIQNSHAFEHCYVPHARVKRFLSDLGCVGFSDDAGDVSGRWAESRIIMDFLQSHLGAEKARFGYAFDLPLVMVTHRRYRDVRDSLLGSGASEQWHPEDEEDTAL